MKDRPFEAVPLDSGLGWGVVRRVTERGFLRVAQHLDAHQAKIVANRLNREFVTRAGRPS
jgi:hypothetical protein